ncbi:peptide deformylase, mitochondrial [Hyalella azteca]|uniref:Peptide deformylase n=1 Tax=Hyalella azteca TaxID=294128 RepID=A0A8B7N5R1_HYAAZ|nr:peptide deformylase, mitochondrial [Hyalella azteca]
MTIPLYRRFALGLKRILKLQKAGPPFSHVCQVGDPVLRSKSAEIPVEDIRDPFIVHVISCMKKVMRDYHIVGLSACQIGLPLRIIAVQLPKNREQDAVFDTLPVSALTPTVIINPTLRITGPEKLLRSEQCASIKGFSGVVARYAAVTVAGYGERGQEVRVEGSGLLARVLQHEMDHIDGKLYIDSMDTRTFHNDGWHTINQHHGAVSIHYLPEERK